MPFLSRHRRVSPSKARQALALVCAVPLALVVVGHAGAATICGAKDPATGDIVRGSLSLDQANSLTSLRFQRSTRDRKLTLQYSVSGCEIDGQPALRIDPNVPRGSNQLPDTAITPGTPEWDLDQLSLTFTVHPKEFDPGKYDAAVRLKASYLQTAYTPLYVSRSTSSPVWPLSAAIVGALVALALGLITAASKVTGQIKIDRLWFLISVPVTIGLGVWVLFSDYWGSGIEVWVGAGDWAATARNAFGVGSAAVLVAVLAKVIKEKV